jgi:branched-chain amino acid transport system substrate-binding protein
MRSTRTALGAALALVLTACGGGEGEIALGVAGPMQVANGLSVRRAAEMAVDEINQADGVKGRTLRLVVRDDDRSERRGLEIARDFRANDSVVAVIGHVNSAVSIRAAPVYNMPEGENDSIPGEPVLQISPASSAPALSRAGPWTFRVTPTDLEFAPVLANWARTRLGSRRAAVLYANDEYGQGVTESFGAAFRRQGGEIVAADPYLPEVLKAQSGVDPYLARAIRRGADALVIGGQSTEGVPIITAARRLGFRGPILGSDGMTGVKDAGAVGEGVFVSSAFLADADRPKARRFVEEFRRRYGVAPDHRAAQTYDIVYLLRDAMREVGTGREALRDYVAAVGRGKPAHDGVSGEIRFNEDGDVVKKPVVIGVVRGGQLVTAR